MSRPPVADPLEIHLLGLVDFCELQSLQHRLVYDLEERGGASLILCEHPPTISVGRSGSRAHIAADDDLLRSLGIKVYWVNRGSGCTLHLPGQLAIYLAISLRAHGLTVASHVELLYRSIVAVLDDFGLRGTLRPELPGVFLGQARVASIGIAVNRWIAYHGLTLNVGPFLDLFDILEEPGIGCLPLRQTSMESRRQRATPMSKVRESLIGHMERCFGLERRHVYTSHAMIRRKVLSHAYAPSPG
jgi:lipoyl(octanoyl) transferase